MAWQTTRTAQGSGETQGLEPEVGAGPSRANLDAQAQVQVRNAQTAGVAMAPKPTEIDATQEAMGQHVVETMNAANSGNGWLGVLTGGINYSYNYRYALLGAHKIVEKGLAATASDLAAMFGKGEYADHAGEVDHGKLPGLVARCRTALAQAPILTWNRDYEKGYANPVFFERTDSDTWKLRKGKSASAAIKAWLAGPTIAECFSTMLATEIDTYRAAIGNAAFDAWYAADGDSPLVIGEERFSVIDQRVRYDSDKKGADVNGTYGNRPVQPGDWCYFMNHPKYLLKHPGGAWQGENSVYMGRNDKGEQLFSGLGASGRTEDQMLDEMVNAYNAARDESDRNAIEDSKKNGTYVEAYDDPTAYPDQVDKEAILSAPRYSVNGNTRKGGFNGWATKRLSVADVKSDRDVALRPQDKKQGSQ